MRTAILIAIALALLALAGSAYISKPHWHEWAARNIQATAFDAEVWASAPFDDTRLRMVDDLLERFPLEGRDEKEIIALLGEVRNVRNPRRNLTYILSPGFMDPVILVVLFDSAGKASHVAVESA